MWIASEESVTGLVRTFMPMLYGWLVTQIPGVVEWAEGVGVTQATLIPLIGILLYGAIRWTAEKLPWVGYLLVVNKKPHYTGVAETAPVSPQQ